VRTPADKKSTKKSLIPLAAPVFLCQKFIANGFKLWYGFFAAKEVEYEQ
jgi:hypothetical protein